MHSFTCSEDSFCLIDSIEGIDTKTFVVPSSIRLFDATMCDVNGLVDRAMMIN